MNVEPIENVELIDSETDSMATKKARLTQYRKNARRWQFFVVGLPSTPRTSKQIRNHEFIDILERLNTGIALFNPDATGNVPQKRSRFGVTEIEEGTEHE